MVQLICLANSLRPDGRCIAGIDRQTGLWIRPVSRTGDAIPAWRCFVGGRFLSLMHIVELDLVCPRATPRYQRENRIIRSWNWHVRDRVNRSVIGGLVENAVPILHIDTDRVDPHLLEGLDPRKWTSLQLVRPIGLTFERDHWTPQRWRATFRDSRSNGYSLKITDPEVTRKLEAGKRVDSKSLLTISLTKPWSPDPSTKPAMCYKLVAAVVEP